jgi:hypothetical protein
MEGATPMTEPTPVQLAPEVEALVLATLEKRVAARIKLVKAVVGQGYADGHKETFRSPLDSGRLGIVYRTDPEPKWVVADREALDVDLRAYPGNLETVVEIVGDHAEVLAELAEHAPHLLADRVQVRAGVVEAALAQSAATGVPAAAGIEMVKPGGSLTVKPDAKAGEVVERMVQAGVITWDGRPAVEAARDGAA